MMSKNDKIDFEIVWQKESKVRLGLYMNNQIPDKDKRVNPIIKNGMSSDTLSFTCINKDGAKLYGGLFVRFNDRDKMDRLGIMLGPDQYMAHSFYRQNTPPEETSFKSMAKTLKKQIAEDSSNKAAPIAQKVIDSVLTEIYGRENALNNFIRGSIIKE